MENKKNKDKKVGRTDSLTYKGNVTIELMHGNKAYKKVYVKNKGGTQLFNFLGNCLTGTFDKNGYPSRIRLYDAFGEELTTTSIPTNDIQFNPASASDMGCYVSYQFIIPYTAVVSGSCKSIKLFNANNSNEADKYSAEVVLTKLIDIDGDSNIRITWQLVISNGEE